MSKVNIKSALKNNTSNELKEYEAIGIKTKHKITYKEEDISVSIEYADTIKITRKDNNKEIVLEFIESEFTNCLYKMYNNTYKLKIFTNKIDISDNYIEIDYIIEEDHINFKLYMK